MERVSIWFAILFVWFSFDIIGISNFVDAPGLISLDMLWWIILLIVLILNIFKFKYINCINLSFIGLWIYLQYISHWKFLLFGATERRIKGYNKFFQTTHHIIPASNNKVIPDTYHIILFILLIVNFLLIIKGFRKKIERLN